MVFRDTGHFAGHSVCSIYVSIRAREVRQWKFSLLLLFFDVISCLSLSRIDMFRVM